MLTDAGALNLAFGAPCGAPFIPFSSHLTCYAWNLKLRLRTWRKQVRSSRHWSEASAPISAEVRTSELRNQGRAQLKQLEKMSQASYFALVACSGYTQCLGLVWLVWNSLSLKYCKSQIISESFPNHFHVRSQISTGLPRVWPSRCSQRPSLLALLALLVVPPCIDPKHLGMCPPKDTREHNANTKEYMQVAHAQTLETLAGKDIRTHVCEPALRQLRCPPSYGYQHVWSYFHMPQSDDITCSGLPEFI